MSSGTPPRPWHQVLSDAAGTVPGDRAGAERGLQLLWATLRAVNPADLDAVTRWTRLRRDVADAFTALTRIAPAGPEDIEAPRIGALEDTPQLRAAVGAVVAATRAAVDQLADRDAPRPLSVAHATAILAQVGDRWTTGN